jgi:hypothetical protein
MSSAPGDAVEADFTRGNPAKEGRTTAGPDRELRVAGCGVRLRRPVDFSRSGSTIGGNIPTDPSFSARRTFDLVLAVTLRRNGVETLYTRNASDFAAFGWFTVVDPLA